ncbi:hypothetical protein LXL04_024384 [Taraxacum kok-saghyz]
MLAADVGEGKVAGGRSGRGWIGRTEEERQKEDGRMIEQPQTLPNDLEKWTNMLGSFENSYIPENPRTPPISDISQTVIPFKKPTSEPSKTLKFERFLAPRSRFFEKVNDLNGWTVGGGEETMDPSSSEDFDYLFKMLTGDSGVGKKSK